MLRLPGADAGRGGGSGPFVGDHGRPPTSGSGAPHLRGAPGAGGGSGTGGHGCRGPGFRVPGGPAGEGLAGGAAGTVPGTPQGHASGLGRHHRFGSRGGLDGRASVAWPPPGRSPRRTKRGGALRRLRGGKGGGWGREASGTRKCDGVGGKVRRSWRWSDPTRGGPDRSGSARHPPAIPWSGGGDGPPGPGAAGR